MNIKELKNSSKMSIILYLLAGIMLIYTLFSVFLAHNYISNLIANKQIDVSKQFLDILDYYLKATIPYVFYFISLIGLGYIANYINNKPSIDALDKGMKKYLNNDKKKKSEEEDWELDDLLSELGNK